MINIVILGRILRLLRIAYEMSQKDVAASIDVDKSFMSMVETGQRRMSLDNYESLADYYEIPLWVLFALAEREPPAAAVAIWGGIMLGISKQ